MEAASYALCRDYSPRGGGGDSDGQRQRGARELAKLPGLHSRIKMRLARRGGRWSGETIKVEDIGGHVHNSRGCITEDDMKYKGKT